MAHLFQTQWAICPSGFDFWAEPCRQQIRQIAKMTISLFDRVENNVGKGEKCWLPAFSPFPTWFSKPFFIRVVKGGDCVVSNKH